MALEINNDIPTAIVTGGSRGIGKAIAKALAKNGLQVLLTYITNYEQAKATVKEIIETGGNAAAFCLNTGDAESIEHFFASEVKEKINLYALINNAGITRDNLLIRMKDAQFSEVLDVNLIGPFICTREAAKLMTRRKTGRIINITSVVGQMGNPGQANYSAAKAGLIGLTKTCAKELGSRNITVNAIAPGFIETDMTAKLDQKIVDSYLSAIPLGRLGTPEEIASLTAFLVSPAAGYITGQVIAINGGLYC